MEFTIWCDESISKGKYFSNFYGGALVDSTKLTVVTETIRAKKTELNLAGEVKWSKVTENYLSKYISLIDTFFGFIRSGDVKVRIMFTQNMYVPVLTNEQADNSFHLLYYQFIKHAFGLTSISFRAGTRLRLYFDSLPESKEKNENFKQFLLTLINSNGISGLSLAREDIAEVDSKKHDILQCLDIILGSMAFRLNDLHLEIAPDSTRRGKRTVAKEKLFHHISKAIRDILPGFNIGSSTGMRVGPTSCWDMPYRHWKFVPKSATIDRTKTK